MRRSRFPSIATGALLVASAVALLAGACQPPVGQPLTDPREILTRTIASTAGLRTATLQAQLQVRTVADPETGFAGSVDGGTLEGQVDLAAGAWSIRGAAADGSGTFAATLVDGTMYAQADTMAGERWTAVPLDGAAPAAFLLLGGGGAAAPDYAAILAEAVAGPAIRAELAGVEDCPSGRCYHVGVEVPRDQVWPLLARLTGLDQVPQMNQAAPPVEDLPTLSLALVVDTATLYLVSADVAGSASSATFQARLELREPNEPVSIAAPPEHLVDRMDAPFGGGGAAPAQPAPMAPDASEILEGVGEEIESGPAEAEPEP